MVFQMHAGFSMTFLFVFDSHHGHCFFSSGHSVNSQGDSLWHLLSLPWTEPEPSSQSWLRWLFPSLYKSHVQQPHSDSECMKNMGGMLYCRPGGHCKRSHCHILRIQNRTRIVYSCIPLSLVGPEISGRWRSRSQHYDLAATLWMYSLCSHG